MSVGPTCWDFFSSARVSADRYTTSPETIGVMRWFSAVSRTIACCPCFTLSMSCGRSRASMMSSSFSGNSSMMLLPASITPPRV